MKTNEAYELAFKQLNAGFEIGYEQGVEIGIKQSIEAIDEIYKCQFYCMEDLCEKDQPTTGECIECFYKAIKKGLQIKEKKNETKQRVLC